MADEDCPHGDDINCCPVCVAKRFPPTKRDRNPDPGSDDTWAEAAAPKGGRR